MPERLTDARIDELLAAESVRDDHAYTVHPTYTGPNCAVCGLPENRHIARAEKEGKNR